MRNPFLREITLPPNVSGHLYLSRMPGSRSPFAEDRAEYVDAGAQIVICLTPLDELAYKSPDYAAALAAGDVPWQPWMFPMADFGVSPDRMGFLALVRRTADHLREGKHIIVHCLFGVGRSGTLAICTLLALGESFARARAAVEAAGGSIEAEAQLTVVRWVEDRLTQS